MIVRPYFFALGLLLTIGSATCLGVSVPKLALDDDIRVWGMVGFAFAAAIIGVVLIGESIRSRLKQ